MELSPKYLDRLSPQSQSGSKWIHREVMFLLSVDEVATSNGHMEKWLFLVLLYTRYGSLVTSLFNRLDICVTFDI